VARRQQWKSLRSRKTIDRLDLEGPLIVDSALGSGPSIGDDDRQIWPRLRIADRIFFLHLAGRGIIFEQTERDDP
jgi:hypothetical protein